tara:strand:+ start:197 stop:511 length:315 start_codon:yes stop_codon:yes gene_type:complete
MIKELIMIANRLDELGLTKEADVIDSIVSKNMNKLAELVGDQHKIDANKDGEITAEDFEMLQENSADDKYKCTACGTLNESSATVCRNEHCRADLVAQKAEGNQ